MVHAVARIVLTLSRKLVAGAYAGSDGSCCFRDGVSVAGKVCLLVYLACPCATMTSIYAIQSDMEPELAARGVLLSTLLQGVLTDAALIGEITCAGSVIIIGLGLNLLGISKFKIADMLPAILFVPAFYYLVQLLPL